MEQAGRRLRLAVIVHMPLAMEQGLDAEEALRRELDEAWALRHAHKIVTPSTAVSLYTVLKYGLAPGRVQTVRPGVRPGGVLRELAPGTDGTSLLCVANITPVKGHTDLVYALRQVADLPWTCDLVGGTVQAPQYVTELRELIREQGLAGRITLRGPLAGADLARAYQTADVLLLPSRWESFGLVTQEAIASGVPVIASRVGGIPQAVGGDIRHGEHPALLLPPGDVHAWTEGIRLWLTAPALRDRMRTAARDRRRQLPDWRDTAAAVAPAFPASPFPPEAQLGTAGRKP
ncbi:glycosyltransferase family 4 protein [Streptomyces sp. NPDC005438]|uniref:glycosyltransferase family 4 protein n=1 Tax=Streptomyces sp. NPDC005438 TaxID=3156880 RepID=UPI0033A80133